MARLAWLVLLAAACVPVPDQTAPRDGARRDAGPSPGPADAARDAGVGDDAEAALEAGAAEVADAGVHRGDGDVSLGDAGVAPDPPPDLHCDGRTMRDADRVEVETYESAAVCEEVLDARGDGVVCAFFEPGDRIGPDAWDETGWRAMNWRTRTGLGRRPHESYPSCLDATRNARGGVVCTNTGVGYKSAHIETNHWCGSSSSFSYCLMASAAARDFWVCSFPSDGDGSGPGWSLTHIVGASCDYAVGGLYLSDCNGMVP